MRPSRATSQTLSIEPFCQIRPALYSSRKRHAQVAKSRPHGLPYGAATAHVLSPLGEMAGRDSADSPAGSHPVWPLWLAAKRAGGERWRTLGPNSVSGFQRMTGRHRAWGQARGGRRRARRLLAALLLAAGLAGCSATSSNVPKGGPQLPPSSLFRLPSGSSTPSPGAHKASSPSMPSGARLIGPLVRIERPLSDALLAGLGAR